MLEKFFCSKCSRVFMASPKSNPRCCGDLEHFDPCKHGDRLVGGSNGWSSVWNEWKDHPLVRKVTAEHAEEGNSSAPSVLNDAIRRAFDHWEESSRDD